MLLVEINETKFNVISAKKNFKDLIKNDNRGMSLRSQS